jgi:hypothetical protein
MNGLSCEFSPTLCKNNVCTLKPLTRKLSNITTGCYVTKSQSVVKVKFPKKSAKSKNDSISLFKLKIEIFTRASSNIYRPGSIRFLDDYCETMRNNNTLMWRAFPKATATITKNMQRCPILV